jgi:hypothetical protein
MEDFMRTKQASKLTKASQSILKGGALAVGAAAAFVPGQAEAHCGHGMYGAFYTYRYPEFPGYEDYYDTGCTGKGAQPMPDWECYQWEQGVCTQEVAYYNCYAPC